MNCIATVFITSYYFYICYDYYFNICLYCINCCFALPNTYFLQQFPVHVVTSHFWHISFHILFNYSNICYIFFTFPLDKSLILSYLFFNSKFIFYLKVKLIYNLLSLFYFYITKSILVFNFLFYSSISSHFFLYLYRSFSIFVFYIFSLYKSKNLHYHLRSNLIFFFSYLL